MSNVLDKSKVYPCQCIDPQTLNVANSTLTGTTAGITIPWNNHGVVFDMNVPAGTTDPSATETMNLLLFQNPTIGNQAFPVQVSTDGSGSCVVTVVWDEKHNFHFMYALGQSHNQKIDNVLFNLDLEQYPTVTFFFTQWPKGWTVKNISSFLQRNQKLPTENAVINCLEQDGTAFSTNINTGAAYSVCNVCVTNDPAPSCSSGGGGDSTTIIYIIIAVILFVGSALAIRYFL